MIWAEVQRVCGSKVEQNGKDKKGVEEENKDGGKPVAGEKTTAEQTQIVGGKAVTP